MPHHKFPTHGTISSIATNGFNFWDTETLVLSWFPRCCGKISFLSRSTLSFQSCPLSRISALALWCQLLLHPVSQTVSCPCFRPVGRFLLFSSSTSSTSDITHMHYSPNTCNLFSLCRMRKIPDYASIPVEIYHFLKALFGDVMSDVVSEPRI